MTLAQLLAALQNAEKILVTVLDGANVELVKFYAGGYENILATILVFVTLYLAGKVAGED